MRSGSGGWFESSNGHSVHIALISVVALSMINGKKALVNWAEKMIRKAVVRVRKVWNTMLWASVLTGGFLSWTGRDAVDGETTSL